MFTYIRIYNVLQVDLLALEREINQLLSLSEIQFQISMLGLIISYY